jgi:hypothetical protein
MFDLALLSVLMLILRLFFVRNDVIDWSLSIPYLSVSFHCLFNVLHYMLRVYLLIFYYGVNFLDIIEYSSCMIQNICDESRVKYVNTTQIMILVIICKQLPHDAA